MNDRAVTLRELAFVRDVLIPRAWVQGPEVDELLSLRARIDGIFAALRKPPASDAEPTPDSPVESASTKRRKKPRHPKERRGSQPHLDGS